MAKIKLKRYKKLEITHDCLVPKGAMQVQSVFKEEKDGITSFTKQKTYKDLVVKFDDDKQIMYNIMVKWNKPDSDGWILDDEIVRRDAMLYFMEKGDKVIKFTHQKDEDGEPYSIDAHVMEFYYAKENDPIYPDYAGSIVRSSYFKDKEEFDFIKELEFETSIEGDAMLEEFEVDDTAYKVAKESALHKIKDLLKNTFKFEDGKLAKKEFTDLIEDAMKDFDSVLENRKNTDIYYAVSALTTAIYDSEWTNLYGTEVNADKFKKDVKSSIKQFTKYLDAMTFETVQKGEEPENKKGDAMEKQEVQALVDESIQKALCLEENQTIADVIQKAIGENKPPETPVVKSKDAEGKEIEVSLVDAIVGMTNEFATFKSEVSTYMTENPEKPADPPEEKHVVEKTEAEKQAENAGF